MNEKYVVNLRDVAIYHADNPFGSCSEKKLLQRGEMVLSEVNLSVAPGEFVYLIGRVGSGKSSLLKTLYAEMQLLTGKGYVAGFDLRRLRRKDIPYLRRRIGIVFQDYQLLTDRNVFMNLYYVMKATGWKREQEIRERIDRVLGLVELGSKSYKMPFELSGGEQQRLVIARALLNPAPGHQAGHRPGRRAHGQPRPGDGRRHHAAVPEDRLAGLRRGDVNAQHGPDRELPRPRRALLQGQNPRGGPQGRTGVNTRNNKSIYTLIITFPRTCTPKRIGRLKIYICSRIACGKHST